MSTAPPRADHTVLVMVTDLVAGDRIDLENDPYVDRDHANHNRADDPDSPACSFPYEYAVVGDDDDNAGVPGAPGTWVLYLQDMGSYVVPCDHRVPCVMPARSPFEIAPFEPVVDGEVGGDEQVGEAYSRRFARRRDDGNHAVVTASYYLADHDPQRAAEPQDGPYRVIRWIDYTTCSDPDNPGHTEITSDYTYDVVHRHGRADDDARRACLRFDPTLIDWDRVL